MEGVEGETLTYCFFSFFLPSARSNLILSAEPKFSPARGSYTFVATAKSSVSSMANPSRCSSSARTRVESPGPFSSDVCTRRVSLRYAFFFPVYILYGFCESWVLIFVGGIYRKSPRRGLVRP